MKQFFHLRLRPVFKNNSNTKSLSGILLLNSLKFPLNKAFHKTYFIPVNLKQLLFK